MSIGGGSSKSSSDITSKSVESSIFDPNSIGFTTALSRLAGLSVDPGAVPQFNEDGTPVLDAEGNQVLSERSVTPGGTSDFRQIGAGLDLAGLQAPIDTAVDFRDPLAQREPTPFVEGFNVPGATSALRESQFFDPLVQQLAGAGKGRSVEQQDFLSDVIAETQGASALRGVTPSAESIAETISPTILDFEQQRTENLQNALYSDLNIALQDRAIDAGERESTIGALETLFTGDIEQRQNSLSFISSEQIRVQGAIDLINTELSDLKQAEVAAQTQREIAAAQEATRRAELEKDALVEEANVIASLLGASTDIIGFGTKGGSSSFQIGVGLK